MKIIQSKENPEMFVTRVEPDGDERVIGKWFFYHLAMNKDSVLQGELIIPEGIEEIEDMAFNHLGVRFNVYHLPKSLVRIGENVMPGYSRVKMFYEGTSNGFKSIAKIREESVYESDGFDRYPYYSGNSAWVTHYYCFDGLAQSVEVYCKEDGVTLLYGTHHRRDGEPPKIKEE